MSVVKSEETPLVLPKETEREQASLLDKAKAGAVVGTAVAMVGFQQSPGNEAARVWVGAYILEETHNPLLVGAGVGLATLVIEGVSSVPVVKVLNDHSEKIVRLKDRFGWDEGNQDDSDKVTDLALALGVGTAAIVVKRHAQETGRTLKDDRKTIAKTAGGIALFSAGVATMLGGGIEYAEKAGAGDAAETAVNLASDWKTYAALFAAAVIYGRAKKGIVQTRDKVENLVIRKIISDEGFEIKYVTDSENVQKALDLEQKVWNEESFGELSVYDKYLPQSRVFAAFNGEDCIGVTRLFCGTPELPPFIEKMDIESREVEQALIEGCHKGQVEELGTAAVDKAVRSKKVFLDLCRMAYRDATSRGIETWGIIMEPRRVQIMNKRLGFTFQQIGSARGYQGGECAAHIMHFSEVRKHMKATKPDLYHWFVDEPLHN